jgi:tRNA threonylcarbamoyladenosine biosynthesis protein TsaB
LGLILHLETATSCCSVAVAKDGICIGQLFINDGFKHAENLMVLANRVLADTELSYTDLNAVAVSAGPGSYTGLRIGVSAAKGICYVLDIPLITIPTLEILARTYQLEHPENDSWLCPMIDARRMEVYTALYTSDFNVIEDAHPLVMEENAFGVKLENQAITFFGDGAEKCIPLLSINPNAHINIETNLRAEAMCIPAFEAFQQNRFADLAYFEPEYLKPYQGTPPKPKTL